MIPRTFSLAALLLVVTLSALACGFAVNYPQFARELAFVGSFFLPASIIAAVLLRYSGRRVWTSVVCLASAAGGYSIGTPSIAQEFSTYLQAVVFVSPGIIVVNWPVVWLVGALGPTLWVLLFGGLWLIVEPRRATF